MELERQIQDDTFKKKQECKNTEYSTENLEKYEKIYSRKFNTCYMIWKIQGIERYWVRDIYSNNYTYRIELNSSGILMEEKTIWIDNKILIEFIDSWAKAKCEFNKALKNIKWEDYNNDPDFININCE